MYKAIIIEDEVRIREALFLMLQSVAADKISIAGVAESVSESIDLIDSVKPNLVFLDIQLKDGTGFEVLDKIKHRNFYLIFTTAYQEHAIRAFKYSAIDFLLKPIDAIDLKKAIEQISVKQSIFANNEQLQLLKNNLHKIPDRISLPTREGIHIIKLDDIVRCETSGSYTTFYLADKRKVMVSRQLKSYEDLLFPPQFFRIHQSHLINMNFVETYLKEGIVILKDKTELPIAQRKKESFLSLIKG